MNTVRRATSDEACRQAAGLPAAGLLSTKQAAAMLGVTGAAVRVAVRRGRLQAAHQSRSGLAFTAAEIERYRTTRDGVPAQCPVCGQEYMRLWGRHQYCSERCGNVAADRRHRGAPLDGIYRRSCETCGREFEGRTARQRFCRDACRLIAFYQRQPKARRNDGTDRAANMPWEDWEVGYLRACHRQDPIATIARNLGRTTRSVTQKVHNLGIAWKAMPPTVAPAPPASPAPEPPIPTPDLAGLAEQKQHLTDLETRLARQGRRLVANRKIIRQLCLLLAMEADRLDHATGLTTLGMTQAAFERTRALAITGGWNEAHKPSQEEEHDA